jgi:hypothetical protein
MINLKVLSTAAAIALVLPMVAPCQAQDRAAACRWRRCQGGGGGAAIGGGGGASGRRRRSAGGGGGFRAGAAAHLQWAAHLRIPAAPTMGFRPLRQRRIAVVSGGGGGIVMRRRLCGGGYHGGGYRHHYRGGGGFWPGVAVGVGVGSTYGYYGSPSYYDDSYGYYDDTAVVAAPPVRR